jgi:biotin carboxylase
LASNGTLRGPSRLAAWEIPPDRLGDSPQSVPDQARPVGASIVEGRSVRLARDDADVAIRGIVGWEVLGMKKTLLVLGAGVEQVPAIRCAKAAGVRVLALDGNPKAPGFALADECIQASPHDAERATAAVLLVHRRSPVHGVLSVGVDAAKTVSLLVDRLRLPSPPSGAIRLAADKPELKRRLFEDEVPMAWFSEIESENVLRALAAVRGLPLIVKPADSRGSRGVVRLGPDVEIDWAWNHALANSPTRRVVVEEVLPGPQLYTESVVVDGDAVTVGFMDRVEADPDRFGPHVVDAGGDMPSALPARTLEAVHQLVAQAARSLGVRTGTLRADVAVTPDGPRLIEATPLVSGGFLATDLVPLSTGVDFLGLIVKLAVGERVTRSQFTPRYHRGASVRFLLPETGVVSRVSGAETADAMPGVERAVVYVREGDTVERITDATRRGGYVIATGATREEAAASATAAAAAIAIDVRPAADAAPGVAG